MRRQSALAQGTICLLGLAQHEASAAGRRHLRAPAPESTPALAVQKARWSLPVEQPQEPLSHESETLEAKFDVWRDLSIGVAETATAWE